jgi:hypothetical protein
MTAAGVAVAAALTLSALLRFYAMATLPSPRLDASKSPSPAQVVMFYIDAAVLVVVVMLYRGVVQRILDVAHAAEKAKFDEGVSGKFGNYDGNSNGDNNGNGNNGVGAASRISLPSSAAEQSDNAGASLSVPSSNGARGGWGRQIMSRSRRTTTTSINGDKDAATSCNDNDNDNDGDGGGGGDDAVGVGAVESDDDDDWTAEKTQRYKGAERRARRRASELAKEKKNKRLSGASGRSGDATADTTGTRVTLRTGGGGGGGGDGGDGGSGGGGAVEMQTLSGSKATDASAVADATPENTGKEMKEKIESDAASEDAADKGKKSETDDTDTASKSES